MVTVLGTSLQNRDLLKFFINQLGSYWFRDGGFYYQKQFKIRKSVPRISKYDTRIIMITLETGSTLASGGLGTTGVKPTYLITIKILEQIFNSK
jgi:hypothetical protein